MGEKTSRLALLSALLLAACGDNLEAPPEPDPRLDTTAPAEVRAGDLIAVTCTLERPSGEIEIVQGEVVATPETAIEREGLDVIAVEAIDVEVACRLSEPNIIDPTPAVVHVVPGPPANVVTTASPNPITAGETLTVGCEVFDFYGNPIETAQPSFTLSPSDDGNVIDGFTAVMTRAGQFTAACEIPGAIGEGVVVDVLPALPASMVLGQVPEQSIYAVGSLVQITHQVSDRFGNTVPDAVVSKESTIISGTGPILPMGEDSFQYMGEGRYRVVATVQPPTEGDVEIRGTLQINVNSNGPALLCDSPADASMRNLAPGSVVTFRGSAADANDVESVMVNGSPATVAEDGSFTAPITTRFGINFVDVAATDGFGEESTKVCSFLASNQWGVATSNLADTIMLKLVQAAWDDGSRSGGINDFDDILSLVLNSSGPRDAVHASLLAANPLKPSSCDREICTFGLCVCVLSSEVVYQDAIFGGPHTSTLALVGGGLQPAAQLNDIRLRLRVRGRAAGIPYDTTGWVTLSYVRVGLILDAALSGGRPSLSTRSGSVVVTVGSIDADFDGIDGAIINIIIDLAQGTVRNLVSNTLRNFVINNFDALLDSLMSNLDISTLGTTFNVPRPAGGPPIPVSFGVGFSSINTTSSRMLIGISTRFTAPLANNYFSLGVALPPGSRLNDPASVTRTAVAAHVGIFNQVLHALWRGGMFEATLTGADIDPDLPAEATASVVTRLPPVAQVIGSQVEIHLGGIEVAVDHPDLPNNLQVSLGAAVRTSVSLNGNDLAFSGLTIEELYISTDAISLSSADQQQLEDMLRPLLQQVANTALNDALPSIPLPTFTIPDALGPYGLPVGEELGITSPTLTTAPQHFTLRGGFGIRP
ncbi:MAG TPA: hypothetical protein VFU21_10700 [Kofleriaceae bacterium]|nr:hypothetical protein [Kofleriaceae bacterium]